ncbi:MAG: deoxynucleoside kinase [Candidatus Absconditabacterales bacterium]
MASLDTSHHNNIDALIFFIEGIIGAGKTTLIQSLDLDNFQKIQEYKNFALGHQNFPKFPYKSREEALASIDFFIDLETKRRESRGENKNAIFDRSLLSCFAFSYATRAFPFVEHNIYKETIQKFTKLYKRKKFALPNACFYLNIDHNTSITRAKKRGTYTGDYFSDPNFNAQLLSYYDKFALQSPYFKKIDGTLPPTIVHDLIFDEIKKITSNDLIDVFGIADTID